MRTANFGRMNVAVSVLLKRAIILAKDESRENDALVAACAGLQVCDVLFGVRCVADDQQSICGSYFLKGLDYEVGVILRVESRKLKNGPVGVDAPH